MSHFSQHGQYLDSTAIYCEMHIQMKLTRTNRIKISLHSLICTEQLLFIPNLNTIFDHGDQRINVI